MHEFDEPEKCGARAEATRQLALLGRIPVALVPVLVLAFSLGAVVVWTGLLVATIVVAAPTAHAWRIVAMSDDEWAAGPNAEAERRISAPQPA